MDDPSWSLYYHGLATIIHIHTTRPTSSGTEQKDDRTSPAFVEQRLIPQEPASDKRISHGWTRLEAHGRFFHLWRPAVLPKQFLQLHPLGSSWLKVPQHRPLLSRGSDSLLQEWSASQLNGTLLLSMVKSLCFGLLPSGNQTWQWKIYQL